MSPAPRITLPRADSVFAAVLLGLMLAADATAATVGLITPRLWPFYVIMPGTYAVLWGFMILSARVRRVEGPKAPATISVAGGFMGKTLVMTGIVLTVAHAGVLAVGTGLIPLADSNIVLKLFVVALGLNLAYMGNAMPKVMSPAKVQVSGNPRLIGRVTAVAGLAMVLAGVFLQPGEIRYVVLPAAALCGVTAFFASRKPRAREPG